MSKSEAYDALFGDDEPVLETPVEAAPIEPVVEPVAAEPPEGPARGADGKFIGKAPAEETPAEPAPAAEAVAAPAAPVTPVAPVAEAPVAAAEPAVPAGFVPVSALQEIRKELQELKQAREAPPAPAPAPTTTDPEPNEFEDPQGHEEWRQRKEQSDANFARKFEMSELMAVDAYGDAETNAASTWAQARAQRDPAFKQLVADSRHPFKTMITAYRDDPQSKRDKLIAYLDTPEKVEAFLAQAEAGTGVQPVTPVAAQTPVAPVAASPAAAPAKLPRSLVSESSAAGAGHTPMGDDAVFKGLFSQG